MTAAAKIAQDLVRTSGFKEKWNSFWQGPGKGITPKVALEAYQGSISARVIHDMDTSTRPEIRAIVSEESKMPLERQTAAVTMVGSPNTYVRGFAIDQGLDSVVSLILHESLHGAGVSMGPLWMYEPFLHGFEAEVGFPLMMGGADILEVGQKRVGDYHVDVSVTYELRRIGKEDLPEAVEIEVVNLIDGSVVSEEGPEGGGMRSKQSIPSKSGKGKWVWHARYPGWRSYSVRIRSRTAAALLGSRQFETNPRCVMGVSTTHCEDESTPGPAREPDGKKQKNLQRQTEGRGHVDAVPPIVYEVLRSPGRPLDETTRAFMESSFGHDFSKVRVHTGSQAAESARAVDALAYTVGRHVVFGAERYLLSTPEGRHLLAHELSHTVQQEMVDSHGDVGAVSAPSDAGELEATHIANEVMGQNEVIRPEEPAQAIPTGSKSPQVQRELLAYKGEHREDFPPEPGGTSVAYEVSTADAASIRSALQALISANKVGIRDTGDRTFFFNRGASRGEIVGALAAAGYTRSQEMADALIDEHNVSVYSRERVTKLSSLFTVTLGTQSQVVERQVERPLTGAERTEAQMVFGGSLNLDRITLAEDPILGVGGYARTLPSSVNFPPGSFGNPGFMAWLIHELTHSWQYQHGVSVFTTIYHAVRANYDYGGEAGLRAALAAGRSFTSFNTEQQGDILSDYYLRVKRGQDVTAWLPFIGQVQGSPRTTPPSPRVPAENP